MSDAMARKKKRNMQLHALDRDDGSVVWSQDTGGQLVQTYQNQSLFAGSLVVPSLSGDIFFYRAGWSGERGGTHARTNQGTRAQTNEPQPENAHASLSARVLRCMQPATPVTLP